MTKGTILLCAGGTGGHLFPAEAVAHEMIHRGFRVHLAADERVQRFADRFPGEQVHVIQSATLASKNPLALARTMASLFAGYLQSKRLLKTLKPAVVAGFGGYPTVPPLLAASRNGIPTLVHEANAVLGRANRFLAKRVDQLAIGFGETDQIGELPVTVTGNPVRPEILANADKPYLGRKSGDPFNLFVFGGSQGASFFAGVLPGALRILDEEARARLCLVQQARAEDIGAVNAAYQELGIDAQVRQFFTDMEKQLEKAHLVVSRAGASTVSELSVMGRPAILVPYPHALDHDQAANAENMRAAGGAKIFPQASLTPDLLAKELLCAMQEPKRLALAAKNAKKTGKPGATTQLADMLETLAAR